MAFVFFEISVNALLPFTLLPIQNFFPTQNFFEVSLLFEFLSLFLVSLLLPSCCHVRFLELSLLPFLPPEFLEHFFVLPFLPPEFPEHFFLSP